MTALQRQNTCVYKIRNMSQHVYKCRQVLQTPVDMQHKINNFLSKPLVMVYSIYSLA